MWLPVFDTSSLIRETLACGLVAVEFAGSVAVVGVFEVALLQGVRGSLIWHVF